MNTNVIFPSGTLALYLAALNNSSLGNLIIGWREEHPEFAIYHLRGNKTIDDSHFFDEVAAALQFPYYFGENWDAFEECVNDLSWIQQSSFLLIFSHADQLLSESEKSFSIFMQIIDAANKSWQSNGVPFHVLLTCSEDIFPGLCERVKSTGVPFSIL